MTISGLAWREWSLDLGYFVLYLLNVKMSCCTVRQRVTDCHSSREALGRYGTEDTLDPGGKHEEWF